MVMALLSPLAWKSNFSKTCSRDTLSLSWRNSLAKTSHWKGSESIHSCNCRLEMSSIEMRGKIEWTALVGVEYFKVRNWDCPTASLSSPVATIELTKEGDRVTLSADIWKMMAESLFWGLPLTIRTPFLVIFFFPRNSVRPFCLSKTRLLPTWSRDINFGWSKLNSSSS